MSIMDDVRAGVQKLDENTIRERLAKLEEDKAKRLAKMKERNANLTDEQKAVRAEKHKAYREKNLDKWKEGRKAYNLRPEVVEKRKAYMKRRNAERKALIERAKELGITVNSPSA